jgi:cytochrome c-type biogenesis protein CcmH/NrfG
LQEYQTALRNNPEDFAPYFGAGMIYKRLKQYPEAVEMFREAVKLEPNNTEAYKQLAATSALAFFVARSSRSTGQFQDLDDSRREARTA